MLKTKFAACALAVILTLGAVALPAQENNDLLNAGITASAENTQEDNMPIYDEGDYLYTCESKDTVSIYKYMGNDTDIVIPSLINGKKVVGIRYEAFKGKYDKDSGEYISNIKSVTIPNTVTEIGLWAFENCVNLKKVIIPDSVKTIGNGAFKNCTSLTDVELPVGIYNIQNELFLGCKSLKSINIPVTVEYIDDGAFSGCENLTDVDIPYPNKLEDISYWAFENTAWLKNKKKESPFVIVNGILIDGSACKGRVVIPGNVRKISSYAFGDCKNIQSVSIPATVKEIGPFAMGHSRSEAPVVDHYEWNKKPGFKIYCYKGSEGENYAKIYEIDYSLLDKVGKTSARTSFFTATSDAVRVYWSKTKNATGYKIYRYDGKKWVEAGTVYNGDTKNFKISGLKPGTTYKFKVKPFVKSGAKIVWGTASDTIVTATRPTVPTITKFTRTSNAIRVFWNTRTCSGYQVQRYDNSKKKWGVVKTVTKPNITNCRFDGLKRWSAYSFRVRAYKTVNGKTVFGGWSKVKFEYTR